jgi:hypothetical protein
VSKLSVFDDRQPVTGLPETKFGGLRRIQNSAETTKTYDLYWFGPSDRVKALRSVRRDAFVLDCMIELICNKRTERLF